MDQPPPRWTIAVVADIPGTDVAAFQAYESRVLPLLDGHGGRLDRRLRTGDSQTEVHILSFGSRAGYESYLADPQRLAYRDGVPPWGVTQRVLEVQDV